MQPDQPLDVYEDGRTIMNIKWRNGVAAGDAAPKSRHMPGRLQALRLMRRFLPENAFAAIFRKTDGPAIVKILLGTMWPSGSPA